MDLRDSEGRKLELSLDLSSKEQITYDGLNDRATDVFSITTGYKTARNCTANVFWAKIQYEILGKVNKTEEIDHDVREHTQSVTCCQIFSDTSTGPIRGCPSMQKNNGARLFNIIVLHKLAPITDLSGDDFFNAWWATVEYHRALWKNGVYHRDISPSNLMYYRNGARAVAVLNDFDLASTRDDPTGSERTGMVPFMALDLLTEKALRGKVRHLYQHDAESFIWVLVWISLRYSGGKKVRKDENGKRPLDDWVTDGDTCRGKKWAFLGQCRLHVQVSGDNRARNFEIANACLQKLLFRLAMRKRESKHDEPEPDQASLDEQAYQELLCNPVTRLKPGSA